MSAYLDALNRADASAMRGLARQESPELDRGVRRRIGQCGQRRIMLTSQRIEETTPRLRTAHVDGVTGDGRPVQLRLAMTQESDRWYATLAEPAASTGPTPFPTAGVRGSVPPDMAC